jgi:hypothetical protein
VSAVERYLAELGSALHVRGAARRRFLRECRDHLVDAAAQRGESEAVRAFGPATEIAAAFEAEVAVRRGVRATFATTAGVLATGGSTPALIHSSAAGATAPTLWAVVFFVSAQLSAVAAALALLQALVMRRSALSPADAALLARRNGCALLAAGLTMFAAGAALPGRGSAVLLLAGPALVCVALVAVLRARSLVRRLEGSREAALRSPLEDLRALLGLPVPLLGAGTLLLLTTCLAAAAAFARDLAERATFGGAIVTAGVEAMAVIACFVVLGRPLGLWRPAGRPRGPHGSRVTCR